MINKKLIGKKIQEGRINKKLTQEELAEAAEISPNYLSKVERGLNMLSADIFLKIVEILDLDLECFGIFNKETKLNRRFEIINLITECNEDTIKIVIPVVKAIIKSQEP